MVKFECILLYLNKIKTAFSFTDVRHISMDSNFRIGVQSGSTFVYSL